MLVPVFKFLFAQTFPFRPYFRKLFYAGKLAGTPGCRILHGSSFAFYRLWVLQAMNFVFYDFVGGSHDAASAL